MEEEVEEAVEEEEEEGMETKVEEEEGEVEQEEEEMEVREEEVEQEAEEEPEELDGDLLDLVVRDPPQKVQPSEISADLRVAGSNLVQDTGRRRAQDHRRTRNQYQLFKNNFKLQIYFSVSSIFQTVWDSMGRPITSSLKL